MCVPWSVSCELGAPRCVLERTFVQESLISAGENGSASSLADLLQQTGMKFANAETKMNLYNVRLHLRLLRRFSFAVEDPSKPAHKNSALFFMERQEEIFGRRSHETQMQESARALDAFQVAVPDPQDLRIACENLHIVSLRGYSIKTLGRHTGETAKALVLYNKIPQALMPRFEKFAHLLKDFRSLMTFHEKYPFGRALDGAPSDTVKPTMPIYASEVLDKLMSEILWPLFTSKKHGSLTGGGGALGIPFVKDLLPTLEQMYSSELAAAAMRARLDAGESPQPVLTHVVTQQEADGLKKAYAKELVGGQGQSRKFPDGQAQKKIGRSASEKIGR